MILLECTTNHHKLQFYLNKPSNKELFETIKVRYKEFKFVMTNESSA